MSKFWAPGREISGNEVCWSKGRSTPPAKTSNLVGKNDVEPWLYVNRAERMDALDTSGIFARERQVFHRRRYEFALDYVDGLEVADVACGLGYGCRILQGGGTKRVTGVDICPDAVQYARIKHPLNGGAYVAGNATELPLRSCSIDVVVCFETIEHVANTAALLAEFHRVLRPNGRLIASSPNDWGLTDYHCHSWTPFELRAEIAAFFEIESTWEQKSDGSRLLSNKPPGIRPWSKPTEHQAECLIVVARKSPKALAAVSYDD